MSEQLELPKISRVTARLIKSTVEMEEKEQDDIIYQHTVFCQTSLPYRNPGDNRREWIREQGKVSLFVEAGHIRNPDTQQWVKIGLPFGAKPRLVMMHMNEQAIKNRSPEIELEDSLTAFAKRVLGYEPNGKEVKLMKQQLSRLAASTVHLAIDINSERAIQVDTKIVTKLDLWFPKDDKQRVLWPSSVRLSEEYFQSLVNHAVPLHEGAVSALSHSAMALDVYAWLAQRLHRIDPKKGQFITWKALKDQFGWNYTRMNNFRAVFLRVLEQVCSQYRAADLDTDEKGMMLWHSPPPIKGRIFPVKSISSR